MRERSPVEVIGDLRIVPVVSASGAEEGALLVEALAAGGLPVAEITLRRPGALEAIQSARARRPDVLVGAGTVVTVEQLEEAVRAGAQFAVSPGLFDPVVRRAQQLGIPILPGVATASDLMHAVDLGLDVVKFFPAAISGGPPAIAALSGPFPSLRFMPTGGVSQSDVLEYLEMPSVVAVGGSWIASTRAIETGCWSQIQRVAAEAVALAAPYMRPRAAEEASPS